MSKSKFYTIKQFDTKAEYRFILGERSYGKYYALKVKALENYADPWRSYRDEVKGK